VEEQQLRRAWLRGYRQGDVELAVARGTLLREQLQIELDAARARSAAMQVEITELHRRLDDVRKREESVTATLNELRDHRDTMDRDAATRARDIVVEAEHRASALRTEGLRQVGELQQQVEQLLALRAGLSAALKRVTEDISDSLDRLAAAPARAIEQIPPQSSIADPAHELDDERFLR
jgi:chromosome segregation ATPase